MSIVRFGIDAIERGWVTDRITRFAIRQLCARRLKKVSALGEQFLKTMNSGPIARLPERANEQHYEVPVDLFKVMLGPRLKYSSCYFEHADSTLEQAETAALRLTCERADIIDGQKILELGCGWGSLSVWMAEHYPNCQITSVSNSQSQRKHIELVCKERGISNLRVETEDMNTFSSTDNFDRVVSVEMFEHMRNYQALLSRVASWLKNDGKLFVHIFCNKSYCYPFEDENAASWMSRYFFSGGIMPSADVFDHFKCDLVVEKQFQWNGKHYQKTLEAWLQNLDAKRDEVLNVFSRTYGQEDNLRWLNRWRVFLMASAELFGFDDGQEWFVSHCLLEKTT